MAYPIRYRLIHRATNKKAVLDKDKFIFIDGNGNPCIGCNQPFYPYFVWASPKDYILEIATRKNILGMWIYDKVGE